MEMETELAKLYEVTQFYKEGMIQHLNTIEEKVSDAVKAFGNAQTMLAITQKHKISEEIMEVLQNFVKMFHTCEKLNEQFNLKKMELDSFSHTERKRHNSNPFIADEASTLEVDVKTAIIDVSKLLNTTDLPATENNENFAKATVDPFSEHNEVESPHSETVEIQKIEDRVGKDNEIEIKTERFSPNPFEDENYLNIPRNPSENPGIIRCYDRREEAIKLIENPKVKKVLRWNLAPAPVKLVPKNEKAKDRCRVIPDAPLQLGQNCVICHIESPSEFYVRLDQNLFENFETRFNEDMNNQHQYVINKFKTKTEARDHLGNFCIGFLPEKHKWYRLEVLDWIMGDVETIFVQLVDYGEKLYWTFKCLKFINGIYELFSKLAIRCHLAGVYSPGVDKSKWPERSLQFFNQLCEISQKTQFVVIFVQFDGTSHAVELRKSSDPDGDCLGELLVKNKFALEVKPSPSEDCVFSEEEDFEEYDNINEAITGYDAQDESRICPFAQRPKGCFKGAACKLEHKKLSEDGITTDKVLTLGQTTKELELPPVGEYIEILITGYKRMCHFYANILTNRTGDGPFNDVLQRLMEVMKTHNVVQTYETFKTYPGRGELVLAHHECEWHRGKCVGYSSNEEIEVFLVDLGRCVQKKLKDLRQMKEDFLHVPFQAVECILDDWQDTNDDNSSKSDLFNDLMLMKVFKAYVKNSSEPLRLLLWDNDDINMGHVLEQWDLAEKRNNNLYPDENSIFTCI